MNNELAIAIPCYNEMKALPRLLAAYAQAGRGLNWQLVVVDNGSSDGTWDYLQGAAVEYPFIKPVRVEVNQGYGFGLHTGLKQCDAPVIGWSHGDLQCSPDDVFTAYRMYREKGGGKILIKGRRLLQGRPKLRIAVSFGLEICALLILWRWFGDLHGQPKIFPRELFDHFKETPKRYSYDVYTQYMASRLGYSQYAFSVKFEPCAKGRSHWAKSLRSQTSAILSFIQDMLGMRFGPYR